MTEQGNRRVAVTSVFLVGGVAAVVSYCHIYDLALAHGEGWRAILIPLSVDGMLVASTTAIVTKRRGRQPAGWVPWLGLTLGIVASLLANIAAAHPDLIARLIAAWPPLALAVSIETLVVFLREPRDQPVPSVAVVESDVPMSDSLRHEPTVKPKTVRKPAKPTSLPCDPDRNSAESREVAAVLSEKPDIGRRQLMRATGLTEYQAREALKAFRAPMAVMV